MSYLTRVCTEQSNLECIDQSTKNGRFCGTVDNFLKQIQDTLLELQAVQSKSNSASSSMKSKASSRISTIIALKQAHAEAAKAKLVYTEQEAHLKRVQLDVQEQEKVTAAAAFRKQADIDIQIQLLNEKKEIAAAEAEVDALENTLSSKSVMDKSERLVAIPRSDPLIRTAEFITSDTGNPPATHILDPYAQPFLREDDALTDMSACVSRIIPATDIKRQQPTIPQSLGRDQIPIYNMANDLTTFLLRKDLALSRLTCFNDKPETYSSWKASFSDVVKEMGVTASEQIDLLIKWLGHESKKHAISIKSANAYNPENGLVKIWERLDDRYGAPEMIQAAILKKLENFPKLNVKDFTKLYELSDIVAELESLKCDPKYTMILSYFDCSVGIIPIVNKLPYNLQEKWTNKASSYKNRHTVIYPPLSVFSEFLSEQAKIKNDPGFVYNNNPIVTSVERKNANVRATSISSRKTEVQTETYKLPYSATDPTRCPIHKTKHTLDTCRSFRSMSWDEKRNMLKDNRICFKCCRSSQHVARNCEQKIQCSECSSERHCTAMHMNRNAPTQANQGGEQTNSVITPKCTQVCGNQQSSGKSCAKYVLVNIYEESKPDYKIRAYAILDEQSNRSLVRPELFTQLEINSDEYEYTMNTCLGTAVASGRRASGCVVEAVDGSIAFKLPTIIECSGIPNIRDEIPTRSAAMNHSHLHDIARFIPELCSEADVLLLIGRDLIEAHHVHDQRIGPPGSPYAQRLSLGWVIIGEVCLGHVHQPDIVNVNKTYMLSGDRASIFPPCPNNFTVKEHDHDSICDNKPPLFIRTQYDEKIGFSREDKQFLDIMGTEMHKHPNGNWIAPLPFSTPRNRLPNNRSLALNRAKILDNSLKRDLKKRQDFVTFMGGVIDKGHAEVAPPITDTDECWYLPLFGVRHPQKPDQIRGVFDSSALYKGVSLNSVMLKGPDLTNSLLGILLRFRKEEVAITADIEQMFYCFQVEQKHRDYLRFFWYTDNDPYKDLIEYRMRVHVFGNSTSPAIATYGLQKSVQGYEPDINHLVENDFYVDDVLKSLPTAEEAVSLLKRTKIALQEGGRLRLHKIASNSKDVMKAFPDEELSKDIKNLDLSTDILPVQRSLGLRWYLNSDTFTFAVSSEERPYTRRGILSTVNSLFDPIGFLAPVTIQGKIILRDLMSDRVDWDQPLPTEKQQEWDTWKESLKYLCNIQIRRTYTTQALSLVSRVELHIYSDASEKAVAAVAYLVSYFPDMAETSFIMGKAKVAPSQGHTIPRLELCAAVLSVQIADILLEQLDMAIDEIRYYTDSKVVLGYISNNTRRFHTYVCNRVDRIHRSSTPQQWSYINTRRNPADVATRGLSVEHLQESSWLTGPAVETHTFNDRNSTDVSYPLVDPDCDKELRAQVTVMATNTTEYGNLCTQRFARFSSWKRLVLALMNLAHIAKSFRENSECKGWHICRNSRTVDSFQCTEDFVIKTVQEETYTTEFECLKTGKAIPRNSSMVSLSPYLDNQGLLRVGGRLSKSHLTSAENNPLIIPGKHHIATLLVRHHHEMVCHQGRHFTEGAIRSAGIWITGAKRLISSIIHICVKCLKLRGRLETQIMTDLPADRVQEAPPFTFVGVDTFGPWQIVTRRTRNSQATNKRWAVLFTCLTIRAIHIEIVDELSSSAFINALRRFVALRGKVKEFRSDRGTNFVGATDDLGVDSINVETAEIRNHLFQNSCVWKFNAPHSSHMGGVWESMIGVSRRILESMLADVKNLTHDVLITLMSEVSAIVNSRPLIPVSHDSEIPEMLTPSILLTQKTDIDTQPVTHIDVKDMYRHQWKRVKHLADIFWSRWRKEYLQLLQPRKKWTESHPDVQVGDVVLLKDKTVARNDWPVGVVLEAFPSSDDKVCKVKVRVIRDGKTKSYIRPIVELVLLIRKC